MTNGKGRNQVEILSVIKGLKKHVTITIKTEANDKKTFSVWFDVEKLTSENKCPRCQKNREEVFLIKFKLASCCIRSQEDKKVIDSNSELFLLILGELKQIINGEVCENCHYEKKAKKSKK